MNLTVHNVYFCFSEVGCTISLRDGTPCKEVPAHTPTLFVAQQTDMLCSDPKAVVKEIPNGVELLHGQMMKEQPETGVDIMKYAECVTRADMRAVNPDYENDLTSDGEWVYPLPEMITFGGVAPTYSGVFFSALKLKKIKLVLPKATYIGYNFASTALEEVDIEAPLVNGSNYTVCGHIIQGSTAPKKMRFVLPKQRSFNQFFWCEIPAHPQRLELFAPKMTEGEFNKASLDKISVLEIIERLQTFTSGTHSIKLGIHVDFQNDEDIAAAVAEAEAKGWTLTVRWNGTPTAQTATTYGLRKPPIYARVEERELPDGTTERVLDWGHYVTNEEGYETFRSVEAAREYYGLPEEDLTNN